ncbi:hypothetical protein B0H13DRAFT_2677477 [Mycena leptocephala]|nr:hypothetical protein B0H13DRAFT_2677477 [Mycena leptocephala]
MDADVVYLTGVQYGVRSLPPLNALRHSMQRTKTYPSSPFLLRAPPAGSGAEINLHEAQESDEWGRPPFCVLPDAASLKPEIHVPCAFSMGPASASALDLLRSGTLPVLYIHLRLRHLRLHLHVDVAAFDLQHETCGERGCPPSSSFPPPPLLPSSCAPPAVLGDAERKCTSCFPHIHVHLYLRRRHPSLGRVVERKREKSKSIDAASYREELRPSTQADETP